MLNLFKKRTKEGTKVETFRIYYQDPSRPYEQYVDVHSKGARTKMIKQLAVKNCMYLYTCYKYDLVD